MEILKEQYFLFNKNKKLVDFIVENNIMVYTNISKININLDDNQIKLNDIIWIYDENNLRIPYVVNNEKLPYYKLNENDNIYDFISLTSLICNNEIINGEKIQYCADIVVGQQSSLNWNPNNYLYSKNMININNLENIDNYNSIFIFTHDLELLHEKFNDKLKNKIIISHNSDHEINNNYNFKLHLCQNTFITNNNIIPLPIGIENTQWFDNNIFHEIRKLKIPKSKFIYFYFNLNTHKTRKECYNKLINKLEWNSSKNKYEYFKELALHKYAICPRGNGLDTHRLWECLYLNTIPIIIKDDFQNITNLPIIILNDWSELNLNKINNTFTNQKISKLTLNYYNKLIEIN
jgi:hypothetical protein